MINISVKPCFTYVIPHKSELLESPDRKSLSIYTTTDGKQGKNHFNSVVNLTYLVIARYYPVYLGNVFYDTCSF